MAKEQMSRKRAVHRVPRRSAETTSIAEQTASCKNNLPKDGRMYYRNDVVYWMGQEAITFLMWIAEHPEKSAQPAPILYQMFLNETTKEVSNG